MPDFSSLTERQREIYDFIKSKIESRGYGPTVREIGLAFDIKSPNGVMCHLKALEKKGLIHREGFSARAIQLIDYHPGAAAELEFDRAGGIQMGVEGIPTVGQQVGQLGRGEDEDIDHPVDDADAHRVNPRRLTVAHGGQQRLQLAVLLQGAHPRRRQRGFGGGEFGPAGDGGQTSVMGSGGLAGSRASEAELMQ